MRNNLGWETLGLPGAARRKVRGTAGAMTTQKYKVDPKMLEFLVCPVTKGPLEYDAEAQELISRQAGLAYPIRDGIPIMLADEARPLDD